MLFFDMYHQKYSLLLFLLLGSISIQGIEIPVPDIGTTPEIFSATSDGEAVIGWSESEYWDYDPMYITRLDYFYIWKTFWTGFEPEPEYEIRYSDYPRGDWASSRYMYYDFFSMDSLDRVHYKYYYKYEYFTNTWNEGSESWSYSPPGYSGHNGFYFNSSSGVYWGYEWTYSTSDYYFTKDGKFIALEYHHEGYGYGYPYDYSIDYTKIVPYTGSAKIYDGDPGRITPRINPTTDLTYFLKIVEHEGNYFLYQVFFEDTMTSHAIYQTNNSITGCDFQPDMDGNLHIMWTEQENGLYYAYWDQSVLGAPVFLGNPETYATQFPQILLNEAGDLLIFSRSSTYQPRIWYKYYYESSWNHFNPETGIGFLDKVQAQLDESGGFSIMQCGAFYYPPIFFWRSRSRESPISFSYYGYPHWNQVRYTSLTPDGNMAALVLLSNGSYVVFRNIMREDSLTNAQPQWILYE